MRVVGVFIEKNPIASTNHAAHINTKPTAIIVVTAPMRSMMDPVLSNPCRDKRANMLNVNLNNRPDTKRNRNITTQAINAPRMPTTLTIGCAKKITEKKLNAAKTIMAIIVPITPQKKPSRAVWYIEYDWYSSEKPRMAIKTRIKPTIPTTPTGPENNDNDPMAASKEPNPPRILFAPKLRDDSGYI